MISLIIPVYNVEQYFKEFLDSLSAQTFTDYEAVFVDDGSTDNCPRMIDEYAEGKDNVIVIHKQNGGLISAWMAGVQASHGDYIAFADSDDLMEPDMLETMHALSVEHGAELVICDYNRMEPTFVFHARGFQDKSIQEGLYTGDALEKMKREMFGTPKHRDFLLYFFRWNKLFRRDLVINNLKYTDERVTFCEDACISLAAFYDSTRVYYTTKPLYRYRVREGSITTNNFSQSFIFNAEILLEAIKKLTEDKGYYSDFAYKTYTGMQICFLIRRAARAGSKKDKNAALKLVKNSGLVKGYSRGDAIHTLRAKQRFAVLALKSPFYGILKYV